MPTGEPSTVIWTELMVAFVFSAHPPRLAVPFSGAPFRAGLSMAMAVAFPVSDQFATLNNALAVALRPSVVVAVTASRCAPFDRTPVSTRIVQPTFGQPTAPALAWHTSARLAPYVAAPLATPSIEIVTVEMAK